MAEAPLLEVADIETSYGLSRVLFGISLAIAPGEMVSLMGRNGMGKTTTVRSIMGLTRPAAGSIRFAGAELRELPAYRIAKLGLGLVPEGRQVFPNLTARENLLATAANRSGAARSVDAREGLRAVSAARRARRQHGEPSLRRRAADAGDRPRADDQSAARSSSTRRPKGLAPLIRDEIWRCLELLRAAGQSILVIDKNVDALTRIADRHYIIERGRVVWTGNSRDLANAGRHPASLSRNLILRRCGHSGSVP